MTLDYYSDFRLPAYNSQHSVRTTPAPELMGQFDPMNSVLYLQDDIAAALDTRGGAPPSSIEAPGSTVCLSFATTCTKSFTGGSTMEQLLAQDEAGDYGVLDVPVRFLLMQHLAMLETKIAVPHFFCWPAAFLAVPDEKGSEAGPVQELLSWHLPPFLTSSLNAGVSAHNLPKMSPEKRDKFVSDYFATQALYDLVRQWIARRGEFVLRYRWKPAMSAADQQALRDRFAANFEIALTDVAWS